MKFRSKGPISWTFLNDLKFDSSIYFNFATRWLSAIFYAKSALKINTIAKKTASTKTPATDKKKRLTDEYLIIKRLWGPKAQKIEETSRDYRTVMGDFYGQSLRLRLSSEHPYMLIPLFRSKNSKNTGSQESP